MPDAPSVRSLARPMIRERLILLAALAATIAAGLLARGLLTGPLAKYLGVALYGTMMFWLVAVIRPHATAWRIALVAVAICWGVEFFQLTPIPATINQHVPLMRLVLGEHFSWWDLPTYAVGVAAAMGSYLMLVRLRTPSQS